MKFVAVTYGTEGDTRPLALICATLRQAGHEAHLLGDAVTLGYAASLGVPATPLAGDMRSVLRADESVVGKGGDFTATTRALAKVASGLSESWLRAILSAGEGCDALILGGLAAFTALSAAEALKVPAIGTGLIPITQTREFLSPFLPPGALPSWLNRWSQGLVNAMIWRSFRTEVNAARARVCGLPPRGKVWADHPMLYGISPSLVPQPADWPRTARICGQWLAPQADWTPPPELAAFLAAGEPPVYLGFGSMAALGGQALMGEAIAGLGGRRALIYAGWGEFDPGALPPSAHLIGDTPHGWLFPRCRLVIHHGGAGTTHAAARAGKASVVVPFAGDQPFWAERLRRVGAAPPPVPAKGLSASRLAHTIAAAETPALGEAAATLGSAMAGEDGLAAALGAIETLARGEPR
jgi:UDP:flavonoid glycosyltransferase YjiC (YdhE family)